MPKALIVEQVVMVMRQGVGPSGPFLSTMRRPNWTPADTHWRVPDSLRTGHALSTIGQDSMVLLGRYHRQRLSGFGMLAATGPLSPGAVFAYAGPARATQESARAFLLGFAPGSVMAATTVQTRHWLLPPERDRIPMPPRTLITQAVEGALGMPLHVARAYYAPAMQAVEQALEMRPGRISALPWEVQFDAERVDIAPLWLLNQVGEALDTDYINHVDSPGAFADRTRPGTADQALAALRVVNARATRSLRFLEVRQGAALLQSLSSPLLHEVAPTVSVFIGQGRQVAAIRGLLDFNWHGGALEENAITPGGVLSFERVREAGGNERFVRVSYHAPTLEQIRHRHRFDEMQPPFEAPFEPDSALHPVDGNLIPLRRFASLVEDVIREAGEAGIGDLTPTATRTPTASPDAAPHIYHAPRSAGRTCGFADMGAPINGALDRAATEMLLSPFKKVM